MIETWIPICIALGSELYRLLMSARHQHGRRIGSQFYIACKRLNMLKAKRQWVLIILLVRVFDCSTEIDAKSKNEVEARLAWYLHG